MSEANKPTPAGHPGTSLVPAPQPLQSRTGKHWPVWLTTILILLIVVVAAAGGWLLWNQSRQIDTLDASLKNLNQQLTQVRADAAPKSQLDSALITTRQTLKTFGDRLDSLDATLTDLRRRSEEGRDSWIRAEAASLLEAANEELQINANPGLALKALSAADARLKVLSDPRLIPVRQQIAKEEVVLRAVPQADVQGMALSLSSLTSTVDSLPLKRVAPNHYEPGARHPEMNAKLTLWQRLKLSVSHMFVSIFTVRHRATNVEPLLAPDQEFFLRRNLELRLTAARAALLNRDGNAFKDSIHTARTWLATYFNIQDPGVKAALDELNQMETQQIDPPLPDISLSLSLLRKLEMPQDKAP
ncbi:MAG TPA: uroporphyrinogen-III C-methyltransferase [Gammaproteobacteria bacterium]|nr:uroporphyrinogen-III C-methyltransferase [Gammaproteobacteria bacterium]